MIATVALDLLRQALSRKWFLGLGIAITLGLGVIGLSLRMDVVDGALAGTPLAPVATFIPADGAGEPNPLCEASGGDAPGIDCDPPVTVLKTKPAVKETSRSADGAGVTQETSATFTLVVPTSIPRAFSIPAIVNGSAL